MKTPRQQYLEDCQISPLIAFHRALMRRIPKKYEQQVIALLRKHPEVVQTQRLEITTLQLGILWRCPTPAVPDLLRRMTARSNGDITYYVGENPSGRGQLVTLVCAIPEASEEQA